MFSDDIIIYQIQNWPIKLFHKNYNPTQITINIKKYLILIIIQATYLIEYKINLIICKYDWIFDS